MTIEGKLQALEPGAMVELFVVDASALGGDIVRFHRYTQQGIIYWDDEEYSPWPIETEGFAKTSDQPPTPKLTIANLDGSISELCRLYDDLLGATVTRIRTFGEYLDAANFGGVNPTADPTEHFPHEVWYIERKSSESNDVVQFELASALDLNGVRLPRRQIIANYCSSMSNGGYRGPYCGYTGDPVAKADDTPTSDPAEDRCGGKLSSCRLREWPDGILNFGGFPAAGLVRN